MMKLWRNRKRITKWKGINIRRRKKIKKKKKQLGLDPTKEACYDVPSLLNGCPTCFIYHECMLIKRTILINNVMA